MILSGCVSSKRFNPDKKYAPQELKEDYTLLRNILEENHPSLYWYTSKDSLDRFFDNGYTQLNDSLTEPQFKTHISYVLSKIRCGHTSAAYSKKFLHYIDTVKPTQFPLSIKLWKDSAVVYENLNRRDTVLKRGTLIRAIDGRPISFYRDSMFQFLSSDGYNTTYKYQALSNRGGFGAWYRNVFGLKDNFEITYTDTLGQDQMVNIPLYDPAQDTSKRKHPALFKKLTTKERKRLRLPSVNNLRIDTASRTAIFTIGTFSNGNHYRRLVKTTFRKLKRQHIQQLILDVRNNGGGNVENSTLLTKYIVDRKFKLADSLYAVNKRSSYGKYIRHYFRNRLFMTVMSKKRKDGLYHFGYFERHFFKPKRRYHFDGDVYLITGGNSFSATALLANVLKGQQNVTIVGEETGGASYGNTAWLIPDATLPHTGVRFRLPLFRLVMDNNAPKIGHGIYPDVEARPTLTDIRVGVDPKLAKAFDLIRQK